MSKRLGEKRMSLFMYPTRWRRVEEPRRQNHVLQNGQSVHIHCKGGHDADRVILQYKRIDFDVENITALKEKCCW